LIPEFGWARIEKIDIIGQSQRELRMHWLQNSDQEETTSPDIDLP
jgi:hypothetical protein